MTINLSTHRFVFEISLSAGRPGRLFLSDDRLAHDTAKKRPVGRFGPCFSLAPPISGRRGTLRLQGRAHFVGTHRTLRPCSLA